MRFSLAQTTALVVLFGLGCDGRVDERALLTDNGRVVESADGRSGGAPFEALRYEIRSEDYRRWLAAQRALDSLPGIDPPDPISLRYADEEEIDRMVLYLESNGSALAAIEGNGMSVRDFVLTSVALEQAMAATHSPLRTAMHGIPERNSAVVRENAAELGQQSASSRVRIVRDDDRRSVRRGWKARGGGKGKGEGKRGKGGGGGRGRG